MSAAQQTELLNRFEFLVPFVEKSFIPYIPEYDAGIDFMVYREKDDWLFRIQLKSRWTIAQKYVGRRIWIAFPATLSSKKHWLLIPHDRLVFEEHSHKTRTLSESWKKGTYSIGSRPSKWVSENRAFETSALIVSGKATVENFLIVDTARSWHPQ